MNYCLRCNIQYDSNTWGCSRCGYLLVDNPLSAAAHLPIVDSPQSRTKVFPLPRRDVIENYSNLIGSFKRYAQIQKQIESLEAKMFKPRAEIAKLSNSRMDLVNKEIAPFWYLLLGSARDSISGKLSASQAEYDAKLMYLCSEQLSQREGITLAQLLDYLMYKTENEADRLTKIKMFYNR